MRTSSQDGEQGELFDESSDNSLPYRYLHAYDPAEMETPEKPNRKAFVLALFCVVAVAIVIFLI